MMPWIHDAFWLGATALLGLFAWKTAEWFNLRVPAFDLRSRFGMVAAETAGTWVSPKPRSSGNSAFDEWRDGELARLEGERQALEARLHAFEGFVDTLRRAKDRQTFDRFMAAHRELSVAEPMVAPQDGQPV